MALSELQRASYADRGHLTVEGVFRPDRMAAAIDDAGAWGATFQAQLDAAERAWYLDRAAAGEVLRKLDNPVHERPLFRGLATEPVLLDMVANLIGPPAGIVFSQIFFKPPEGGGAKPAHQDNFYFGPDDRDGLVTAWIALDDATRENGCLEFADGTNRGPVLHHLAPPGEPFNLQIPEDARPGCRGRRFIPSRQHPAPVRPQPVGSLAPRGGGALLRARGRAGGCRVVL